MSNWSGGVLTAAGRTLQAKVEAGTTPLVLTKIKLGDGTESMDAVDNLTDLVGAKAVLGISSAVSEGDHATITGVVLSTQLQAGFWCREWGLFAQDPVAGEILYMITIDNQPEWLPASTAAAQVSATYAMNIAVANATNIEVRIDPAGLVDVEMLDSYMGLAKRSTACVLGDTAMLENLPAMYFLECTTAGTTGATAPVITPPVTEGTTINDGTVVWTVRRAVCENDYPKTSFGTAVVNHLLRSTLARLISAVSTDSVFSKLLKLALEAAGLRYSMGTNGYICLGSLFGHLILQWGVKYGLSTEGTITLPIAFASKNTYVNAIHMGYDSTINCVVYDLATSGFKLCTNRSSATNYMWLDIGY
ncbi:phage tail protein [uncultured Anaerovibrio sp.]|uniref:phage tail-collar fiber domain-containing protein n=1 Tax=uncultured Anaerovibrio sp. TaxID=361586 RepID=UPI0026067439|nr:phage tail protein [uncultured Anaerovibrio sp.]